MAKKVLVVEDLPEVRTLLREAILEPLGFEVLDAETVKEAWALFQTHRNDLAGILMDGELPEFTDELIRKIKGLGFGPIIAISGRRNPELLAAGCDDAVEKSRGIGAIEHMVVKWFR